MAELKPIVVEVHMQVDTSELEHLIQGLRNLPQPRVSFNIGVLTVTPTDAEGEAAIKGNPTPSFENGKPKP